jgi:hypothetical protein
VSDPTENGHTEGDHPLSLAERAAIAAEQEPDQETLFPDGFMDGDPWTLANVHKSRKPVEVSAILTASTAVPLRGGIPAPDSSHRLLVTTGKVKYEVVPEYDKGGDLTDIGAYALKVKISPGYIMSIDDPREFISQEFDRLLIEDGDAAVKLAEELLDRARN